MSDERVPVAHLVTATGQKQPLMIEDVLAIVMALEGRTNMIKEGLRKSLLRRLEALYAS